MPQPTGRRPRWTPQEMDDYERARSLLSAMIAAYSARIADAPDSEAARALRTERTPLLEERDRLTADHRERVAEILRDMPDRLRAVREGGSGE
ncbi:hypothetical protein [Streptomyces sp. NPDC001492]